MTGKHFFVRSMLTVSLPLILIYAFIAEMVRGIGSSFRYAWLEVRINYASYLTEMRRGDD